MHTFPSIPHPMGTLTLTVRYLTTQSFHLDEMESVLLSRFFGGGLEGRPEFTPTLPGRRNGDGDVPTGKFTDLSVSPCVPTASTTFFDRG